MKEQQIYCFLRNEWVAAVPEEFVRQSLLSHLIQNLHFPKSGIVVEKNLKQLPHIQAPSIPDRRADILCYTSYKNEMHPLLLIECKAVKFKEREINQLIGYNHFVKASFIALVNETEYRLGWLDSHTNNYTFINYIPTYQELIKSLM